MVLQLIVLTELLPVLLLFVQDENKIIIYQAYLINVLKN